MNTNTDMPVVVANGVETVDLDAIMAQIAALQADKAALAAKLARTNNRKLTLKVSEKGAVSLYGMGRFPVTLYGEQWEKLIAHVDEIKTFLSDNADKLSVKE